MVTSGELVVIVSSSGICGTKVVNTVESFHCHTVGAKKDSKPGLTKETTQMKALSNGGVCLKLRTISYCYKTPARDFVRAWAHD